LSPFDPKPAHKAKDSCDQVLVFVDKWLIFG